MIIGDEWFVIGHKYTKSLFERMSSHDNEYERRFPIRMKSTDNR